MDLHPALRARRRKLAAMERRRGPREAAWRQRGAAAGLLVLFVLPLLPLVLAHRLIVRRKALIGWREKLTGRGAALPAGRLLVQAVSLGEANLLRGLLPGLEAAAGAPAVLATTTDTGAAALAKHFADHDRCFLPFDLPWAVPRFLARCRPRALVLVEAEIWPLLLCALAERRTPAFLVNARVSDRSFARYAALRPLVRPLFRSLAGAACQNGRYAARLAWLGVRRDRLHVTGTLKADAVAIPERSAVEAEMRRLGLDRRGLLLAASTSAGEDEALILAWRPLAARWRLVICPRHPERGAEVADLCRTLGVAATCSTEGPLPPPADHAIIVDEIGVLGRLYALCAGIRESGAPGIAVVGGSLGSGRGGQNMFEAAAAGCCTVVGWDTASQPDAMGLLRAAGGVVELEAGRIAAQISALAADPRARLRLAAAGRNAWKAGLGATARTVRMIHQWGLGRQVG